MTNDQLADIYEALEKAREARKYLDSLEPVFKKPFMAILKNVKGDLQQAIDAVEYMRGLKSWTN